ncbi:hypothetical protein ACIGFL_04445 [Pseudomonas sp. NPDC077649]|nr:hypothetical protein [Pseudomonas sp. EGD-AK9]ERI49657.1 hypothetical protein N878_11085 [Pseudomonas sp. EGD-AK9]
MPAFLARYPAVLPAKTRAFVDFLTAHFETEQLARRFCATQ